jgi:hypothetical protein
MSGKKANDNPGLCPVKGQKDGVCSWNGVQNQYSILSLSINKSTPHYQMLVIHSAFYLSFCVLPRYPQGRIRLNKLLNRTVSCELARFRFLVP